MIDFQCKKPCPDCPFVKGSSTNQSLDEDRIPSIVASLQNNHTFSCHKTIPAYTGNSYTHEQHCAGALAYLVRHGDVSPLIRFAQSLGLVDLQAMADRNKNAPIIDRISNDVIQAIRLKNPEEYPPHPYFDAPVDADN